MATILLTYNIHDMETFSLNCPIPISKKIRGLLNYAKFISPFKTIDIL
jgi:hypothetical protein